MNIKNTSIIFLGNNNPKEFKRGVENVIYSQSKSYDLGRKYYIFFDKRDTVFRWDDIICIGIKSDWKKFIKFNLAIRRIKQTGPTIIHSHGPVRTLLSSYKTDILTVHDAIYYQRKGLHQKLYQIFYLVEKLAYLRSKKIHFISKYAKEQSLFNKRDEKKSLVIYNSTPLEELFSKDVLNSKLEDKEYYDIIAVRGIQERTRIDLLIDFADFCKDKKFNEKKIRVIVAGKGPLLNHYQNIIKEKKLNNITLLGFVPDNELVRLYSNCDCVIITCDHAEGFGLPIIEGYALNKPVIGSNKCAVPEIIIDPNFLFENNAQSIFSTLNNMQPENFDFKKYYETNFSMNAYKTNMKAIYYEIANNIK